jgi:lipid-binding SYLF domain-containing protein
MKSFRIWQLAACLALPITLGPVAQAAHAATAAELNADGKAALNRLYAHSEKATKLAKTAHGILVFPKILKAGLVIGGQGGEGVLFIGGKPARYYKIGSVSYGLQAGGQTYSYALFLMTDKAVHYLDRHDGWSIGSGPSVVVMDEGAAKSTTSTTVRDDVYAFPFGQSGLMAGLGLEGSKISRIKR